MPEMTLDIDTSGGGFRMPYNKRGECSVCGKPAYDGRSTKCEEHRTKPKRSTSAAGGTRSSDPITFVTSDSGNGQTVTAAPAAQPAPPPPQPMSPKAARAETIKGSILRELNPQLVKGFALVCRPVPEHNFYQLTGGQMVITDPLGKTPMFADWEADIIGKCVAELETQPMVQIAGKAAGPVVPYLYMLGGLAVIGWHGYNAMMTRDRVLAQWERMNAENRARNNGVPDPEPMPPAESAPQGGQVEAPPPPSDIPLPDENIDGNVVAMIPPTTNGSAPPMQEGEFSDIASA